MTTQEHELYDMGYCHGLQGDEPEWPNAPKYMEGWTEGFDEMKQEMEELDLGVD